LQGKSNQYSKHWKGTRTSEAGQLKDGYALREKIPWANYQPKKKEGNYTAKGARTIILCVLGGVTHSEIRYAATLHIAAAH
jgi:hypothetical protein